MKLNKNEVFVVGVFDAEEDVRVYPICVTTNETIAKERAKALHEVGDVYCDIWDIEMGDLSDTDIDPSNEWGIY